MGVNVTIGGHPFHAINYTVEENATPLAAGDSFGSVGTVTFTIPPPDPYAPRTAGRVTGTSQLLDFGPEFFLDADIRLTDSRKGFTLGKVNSTSVNDDGTITFTCLSRMGELNAYGVQAQPFSGTLNSAFAYYLSLAGITTDLFVDDTIASRQVVFPGWNGELWYRLKQIAVAQDADISLASGVILLRPIRMRVAVTGRDISRSKESRVETLAQAVEVYKYDNRVITNELVYPPGGWTPDVEVLNVNAGETADYTLELSASLSSFQTPTHETSVEQEYAATSVYTIVGSDGLPVSEALWEDFGGRVDITLNPDTTSLNVHLVGAVGIPVQDGTASTNFSLALASDASGNRYSTLRIVGSGVTFNKQKVRVRTGVPASQAATDVGVTIDNPFLSTADDVYRTGVRAARAFAGQKPAISGSLVAINRRGDTGDAEYPTYGEVQTSLTTTLGTPTYSSVETYYTSQGLVSYSDVRSFWFDTVRDDFTNQVFGNVNGARVWDKRTRRWYRIRQATINADTISFGADDDLTHEEIETFHAAQSRTYGDVQLILGQFTYKQAEMVGVYGN